VDDNDDTCFLLQTLLGREGFEVKTADSFVEALGLARTEEFDLFVLDSCYPEGAGADLCRQLRRIRPGTPVIFYTGAAYEDDGGRDISAGAYVLKPEIDGLLAAVHQLSQGHRRAGRNEL
jgi:DNA-binding response OmpR family regulator